MNKKVAFVFLLIINFLGAIHGQEVLNGLSVNPALVRLSQSKINTVKTKSILFKTPVDFIPLPFIDDFSKPSPYPDNYYWSDSDAYINSTFPLNPPSIGVATFDALNKYGHIYTYSDSGRPNVADMLTSRPIDLDSTNLNVYLSFFYEPRGIGDKSGAPAPEDSLVVDFYAPKTQQWNRAWSIIGDTTKKAVYFKQVFIPIDSAKYLKQGFRFRFKNYITQRTMDDPGQNGNTEYWHIDYVRLDKNRSANDSVIRDLALVAPPLSLILPYQSIPVNHYKIAFPSLDPKYNITLHNLDTADNIIQRRYVIKNIYTNHISNVKDGANLAIKAGSFLNIQDPATNPFYFDDSPDSAIFEVRSSFSVKDPKVNVNFQNDTAIYYQVFKNYFAYDDGSPERGYGLSGEGAENSMAAMGFESFVPDSLTGISFYFNPTYKDTTITSKSRFYLFVWDDNNGAPGKVIYQKTTGDTVRYGDFPIYKLDSTVLVYGTYYIGWKQEDNTSLNMGFDLNNDNHKSLFVKFGTDWSNSEINGSLMIRPVFRKIKNTLLSNKTLKAGDVQIYPNPASETVFIDGLKDDYPATCTILSMMGKPVLQQIVNTDNALDVSNLATGLYILKITGRKNQYAAVKLMIQH